MSFSEADTAFALQLGSLMGADRGRGQASASVDRARALRYLGYANQPMDAKLEERFFAHAKECEAQLRATYCWRLLPAVTEMGFGRPQVNVSDGALILPGSSIARHLRGAKAVVLMAVTLGFDCERNIARLGAVSPTDQLLYSTCASTLVESAMDFAQDQVDRLMADAGYRTGPQYAPGYGDLPIAVQPRFLDVLDAGRQLGVRATEGDVLVPVKSITACVGVFPADLEPPDERNDAVPCDNCSNRVSCLLKEKGLTCYDR